MSEVGQLEHLHSLVHFLHAYIARAGPGCRQDPRDPSWSPKHVGGTQMSEPSSTASQEAHVSRGTGTGTLVSTPGWDVSPQCSKGQPDLPHRNTHSHTLSSGILCGFSIPTEIAGTTVVDCFRPRKKEPLAKISESSFLL